MLKDKGKEQCFPGWHAGKSRDISPALLEKQVENKVNTWEESQGASGRVEVPIIQTTAGRDGKLMQRQ